MPKLLRGALRSPRAPFLFGWSCVLALLSYPFVLSWLGLLGLGALSLTRWRRQGRPFPASPLTVPFVLLLASAAFGLRASLQPHYAMVSFFGLLAAFGTYFLISDSVRSPEAAQRAVWIALGVVLALVPLAFLLAIPNVDVKRWPALRDGIDPWRDQLVQIALAAWDIDSMGQRFRLQAGGVGALAVYGFGLALGPLLAGRSRSCRLLGLVAVLYTIVFLLLALSRGAMVSAAIVLALCCLPRYARWLFARAPLVLGGLAALQGLLVLRGSSLERPLAGDAVGWVMSTETLLERQQIWQNLLFIMRDFPLTGVGLSFGSTILVFDSYFPPFRLGYFHAHSIFLETFFEQGWLGLAGLLALIGLSAAAGCRILARAPAPGNPVAISASGAALALVLTGLTDVVASTAIGQVMLFGAIALLFAAVRIQESSLTRPARAATPARHGWSGLTWRRLPVPLLAGTTLGIALVLASWFWSGTSPLSAGRQALTAFAAQLHLSLGSQQSARARLVPGLTDQERSRLLSSADWFLQQSRALAPEHPAAFRQLAELALARSQRAAGVALLAQAEARSNPADSQLSFQLGRLYRQAGEIERAIAAWSRLDDGSLPSNRAHRDAQLVLWGLELLRAGRWQEAATLNRAAIAAAPVNPEPFASLSIALSRSQGVQSALATQEQLSQLYPDVPHPFTEVNRLNRRIDRADEAASWARQAETIWESAAWKARVQASQRKTGFARVLDPSAGLLRTSPPPAGMMGNLHVGTGYQAVLITNTLSQTFTYWLEVAYSRQGQVFTTAHGTASDLHPGRQRAILLLPFHPSLPLESFAWDWQMAWDGEAEGERRAATAARIEIGPPIELTGVGFDVRVSNQNAAPQSFILQAMLLRDGKLVGVMDEIVRDLAPGSTRIVTLLAWELMPSYDQVNIVVDKLLS
jgi:tetratricopeptide (TPR) repeat protein